jgi:hypothetical protein
MADSTQPAEERNSTGLRKQKLREANIRYLENLSRDPNRLLEYRKRKAAYAKEWRSKNKDKTKKYRRGNASAIKARKAEWHGRTKHARAGKISENAKRRWAMNKESLKQYQKIYRQANAESIAAQKKLYYEKNQELLKKKSRECGKEYYAKNKKKVLEKCKKYAQENKKKIAERSRHWYQKNKTEIFRKRRDYKRRRRETDANYAIECRLRARMAAALRAAFAVKRSRSAELIGCSAAELRVHLEMLFQPGMSWENRRLWHIDHIIPCSAFDLRDEEQQAACFHFTNLRPMWAKDNLAKRDSLPPGQAFFGFSRSARTAAGKAQSKQEAPRCKTSERRSKKKSSTETS